MSKDTEVKSNSPLTVGSLIIISISGYILGVPKTKQLSLNHKLLIAFIFLCSVLTHFCLVHFLVIIQLQK